MSTRTAAERSNLALHLENVKFEHTVFALPFAYLGMILAADGLPTWWQFIWISVAMAAARTMAMSFNRLIDRELDRRNPRTAGRPLASGRLAAGPVFLIGVASGVVLAIAAWMLSELALRLLPIALVFLLGYHYTKRFTWLSHFVLGLTDAAAPMGAWVAVTNSFDLPALLLGLAVMFWIGGFDIIYACQDIDFDRANRLYSIPPVFGPLVGLWVARACHAVMLGALAAVGMVAELGFLYWIGWALAAALLVYEHALVKPNDFSRLNIAFFNVNGYLSVAVFLFTLAAVLLT